MLHEQNQRAVGQRVRPQAGLCLAVAGGEDEEFGIGRRRDAVQHHLQQGAVFVGVADQHRAEQALAVGAEDDLLVDLLAFVDIAEAAAARRLAVRVADAGDVDAHQLELGAEVGTGKGGVALAGEVADDDAGHFVTRCDQPEQLVVPGGALADRVDVLVAGLAVVVDREAAAGADGQRVLPGQLVARADPGREHDHVGFEIVAVGEHHAVPRPGAVADFDGVAAGVHVGAEGFDLVAQDAAAFVVDLHCHQARGEFDDVGFQPEILERLGAFQPEQAAADDHAAAGDGARGLHSFEILDRAIDEAVRAVVAGQRRDEGVGAGGDHQLVVGQRVAVLGGDGLTLAVDGCRLGVEAQCEAAGGEEVGGDQRQVVGALAAEEFRQMDAVVGGARFFAQHRDFHSRQSALMQFFKELVAHHAVADDDYLHARSHLPLRWNCRAATRRALQALGLGAVRERLCRLGKPGRAKR